jgi:hypothetical protein
MPEGIPRYVRIYDNAGLPDESADHLTVIFTGKYRHIGLKRGERPSMGFQVLCMNESPFHPLGFCQHAEYDYQIDVKDKPFPPDIGGKCHLGRRIPFSQLNEDCQQVVMRDYLDLWNLYEPGDGYLEVKPGKEVLEGDEEYLGNGQWSEVSLESVGEAVQHGLDLMVRRKVG